MYSVCVIVAEWCFRCFLIVGKRTSFIAVSGRVRREKDVYKRQALKIAPVYHAPVIHLKDASQNATVAARLMNPNQKGSS